MELIITAEYLRKNPSHIFVFGDNTKRRGKKGSAELRGHRNTYGFITKVNPDYANHSYYTVNEYIPVFNNELAKLKHEIISNPSNIYLISKLGAGLANKYKIWEKVIKPVLKKELSKYENVKFLY